MENTINKQMTLGRRKESVARVQLIPGKGDIRVNGRPIEKYFLRETDMIIVRQPLQVTDSLNKYDVVANIRGGGLTGQAGALKLGIARALVAVDPALKESLRKQGFLTRDPRATERKKYGQKGARKRFQWTKR
jgi:small subunit ribosomal protein S9